VSTLLLVSWLAVSMLLITEFTILTHANPIPLPEWVPLEHGYIRSNGDVDPQTLPIQRTNNNVYTLKDDLVNYTLDIQKDDVVFDGNGFLITIPPYDELDQFGMPISKIGDPSINIANRNNITIKNTRFNNCFFCIEAENSSKIIIIQNAMNSGNIGIHMKSCVNCDAIGNEIIDAGLWIINSDFINIAHNQISRNREGARLSVSHSNVSRNDIVDNEDGLYLKSPYSNNRIFENNFVNNKVGLLRGNLNTNVNNSVFSNYWFNNQVAIKDLNEGGVPSNQLIDESPLATPVPSTFDPTLLPLPQPTTKPSPTPTTQPTSASPSPNQQSPTPSPSSTTATPTSTFNPTPPPTTITPADSPGTTPTPTNSPTPSQQPKASPDPQIDPSPTPWITFALVTVALVGVGLLVYFKKRDCRGKET
jgi:parallel beta-helix repeat protein